MTRQTSFTPIPRLDPYAGLVIDADAWSVAHQYHRRHHDLHLAQLHGSGIVSGMAVRATTPPSNTVLVEYGMAVDPFGRTILLPRTQRIEIAGGGSTTHIAVEYAEDAAPAADGLAAHGRVVEGFRVRVLDEPPEPHMLELARVAPGGAPDAPITDAADPLAPRENEIDLRGRRTLATATPALSVEHVTYGPDAGRPAHALGLQLLSRLLNRQGIRAQVVQGGGPDVEAIGRLLYVAGRGGGSADAAIVERVASHVARGGWALVDPCGDGREVVEQFAGAIEARDGCGERTAEAVLHGLHVFGEPPAGAVDGGAVAWGPNLAISSQDYGCAWSGRSGEAALPRERIRAATEFGMNIAWCAATLA